MTSNPRKTWEQEIRENQNWDKLIVRKTLVSNFKKREHWEEALRCSLNFKICSFLKLKSAGSSNCRQLLRHKKSNFKPLPNIRNYFALDWTNNQCWKKVCLEKSLPRAKLFKNRLPRQGQNPVDRSQSQNSSSFRRMEWAKKFWPRQAFFEHWTSHKVCIQCWKKFAWGKSMPRRKHAEFVQFSCRMPRTKLSANSFSFQQMDSKQKILARASFFQALSI